MLNWDLENSKLFPYTQSISNDQPHKLDIQSALHVNSSCILSAACTQYNRLHYNYK